VTESQNSSGHELLRFYYIFFVTFCRSLPANMREKLAIVLLHITIFVAMTTYPWQHV